MSLDLSRALVKPPIAPSKWDIIPLHTSDRGTFKQCRRKWNWSSPARNNLVPRASIHGIVEPLWFGTGIHYALERGYNPELPEDFVVAWETWFDLQLHGGLVTEAELSEFEDRSPEPIRDDTSGPDRIYRVKGLDEIQPDFDPDHFAEVKDLGIGMMKFYKDYAREHDNFSVIATEHTFSVPILDESGQAIYMLDTRRMPESWLDQWENDIPENKYGPLVKPGAGGYYKQVHARGRMDLIIQDNDSGRYGLKDYKTAKTIGEDYFRHIELDEQVTTYAFAAEREAEDFDLPYQDIDFIVYEAILKAFPRPPTITTRGMPSINRQEEATTAELFAETIDVLGIRFIYDHDTKMQAYYAWLLESGDERFVNRYIARRNKYQKASAGRRLFLEAQDMCDPGLRIYPNPTKDYSCLNCAFRAPCIAMEDGSDWQSMIDDGFETNHDR
jgi:hypothetical protein